MRVFCIDPRLDGVAVELDLVLAQRQLLAECHPQLPFDQIYTGDQFGHGMFDLQAGIHFDEEHLLAVGDKLDGAGANVVDGPRGLACSSTDRLASGGIKGRRRRLLDHLLMTPLQGAFPLEQRQQVAMAVADDLHLDVAWILDEFLDQHSIVAECGLGLALGADDSGGKFVRRTHDAHAASAAAR